MTPSHGHRDAARDENAQPQREEDQQGQVSEAGGALTDDETALAGADAIPDKTTGTAGDNG